jgi:hypothetical protein
LVIGKKFDGYPIKASNAYDAQDIPPENQGF